MRDATHVKSTSQPQSRERGECKGEKRGRRGGGRRSEGGDGRKEALNGVHSLGREKGEGWEANMNARDQPAASNQLVARSARKDKGEAGIQVKIRKRIKGRSSVVRHTASESSMQSAETEGRGEIASTSKAQ